jgi:hypothetical protein
LAFSTSTKNVFCAILNSLTLSLREAPNLNNLIARSLPDKSEGFLLIERNSESEKNKKLGGYGWPKWRNW